MRKTILAFALVLLPLAAAAQDFSQNDRKAIAEDPLVAAELKKTATMASIPESAARVIGPRFYRDNSLTRNESDIFLELLGNTAGKVTIATPEGDSFQVPVLSEGARYFLALHDLPDLNTMWLKGPKEMKAMVDVTILNPNVVPQIEQFFGMNLYVSWRASVAMKNNRYLRETLTAAMNQFTLAGPETERLGRRLLYRSMMAVDAANNNFIPNDLYIHLRQPAPAN